MYSEWSQCASELYRQLCDAYQRLSLVAEDRVVKLERCLQLRLFEDKASTVSASYFLIVHRTNSGPTLLGFTVKHSPVTTKHLYLILTFRSHHEIFIRRSWYSVLASLDATISCRIKRAVVGVLPRGSIPYVRGYASCCIYPQRRSSSYESRRGQLSVE